MKVTQLTLHDLAIPFKEAFGHARHVREASDTILIEIECDTGQRAWGEVLARPYVTGESHARILESRGELLGRHVLGLTLDEPAALRRWVTTNLERWPEDLALFGGLEIALWGLMQQHTCLDLNWLLGPHRTRPAGRCETIGFETPLEKLRARAIGARLAGATAVKLKVGRELDEDLERIRTLRDHLADDIVLRLDGNAMLTPDVAHALLEGCTDIALHSLEEPFPFELEHRDRALVELFRRHRVPLMADESVCSLADLDGCLRAGTWQFVNLRIGKHGGLHASVRIRDRVLEAGLGLVAGSMVGESGVLDSASRVLLARSECLPYVEGLGQNTRLLSRDPVCLQTHDPDTLPLIAFRSDDCGDLRRQSIIIH